MKLAKHALLYVFIMIVTCLFVFLCLQFTKVFTDYKHPSCGYDTCNKPRPGYINVHLIPHTHNDPGWLKTMDQYFNEHPENEHDICVKCILDSTTAELEKDNKRKFVYAETGFFWMWWKIQNDTWKHIVRKLVNEGRLEFVGGGWVMHDEAVTHYQSIVDQMSWGFRKLNEAFGECGKPRVGWQIDAFGHSRESASLMASFGFDGLFFARIDYKEKKQRLANKSAEVIWETSPNLGTDLFTSIFYEHYSFPPGLNLEVRNPAFHKILENNDRQAAAIADMMKKHATCYKSGNILVPMGDDFTFQKADVNFIQIQKLIDNVNSIENGTVNLFYSTPSCYLKAVNDEHLTFPTKTEDFFPYRSEQDSYWTGFYTSRPTLKYFGRLGNNYLQICKQLFTIAKLDDDKLSKLDSLREAMALLQHHDALTGTEKQQVANDYAKQLFMALTDCETLTSTALSQLMSKPVTSDAPLPLHSCWLLNISSCEVTETNDTFVVTLYNPLSRQVSQYVRVPVHGDVMNYVVRNPSGTRVTVQLVPIPEHVQRVPGRRSDAVYELVFLASDIPPLGFKSYYATNVISQKELRERKNYVSNIEAVDTNKVSVYADGVKITQDFLWYKTIKPEYYFSKASGAYVFQPNGDPIVFNPSPISKFYSGPLVDEIHQVFNDSVTQVIRTYKDRKTVEYHWMIGPISFNDSVGKEVITRYNVANINSNKTFFTDSNGREMLKRVRDKRPDYKYKTRKVNQVSGNYYPITTRIMIKDNKTQVSIITDRAQGGSSLNDSQIELMLHRRCSSDDGKGLGEELNERAFGFGLVARGTHYVTSGHPSKQSAVDRLLIQEKVMGTWTFFTPTLMTFDQWKQKYNMELSGLNQALPSSVQILTLEPWKENSYLIRLEHIMEKNDDPEMSKPVTVDLKNIFVPFKIKSIKETTLGGNQWLKDLNRLVWNKDGGSKSSGSGANEQSENLSVSSIKLKPMQIRSFIVYLKFK